ncbi:Hypothetical predicted protein [Scomber scombrus]|uniref:Uncharacterized protein n=1 Tax=Scomber scombrus TaxID=13677 RepID=A0AAV1PRA4_SCOSC
MTLSNGGKIKEIKIIKKIHITAAAKRHWPPSLILQLVRVPSVWHIKEVHKLNKLNKTNHCKFQQLITKMFFLDCHHAY